MDLTIIIIGVAILAAFIVPTVLISNASKNKKKRFSRLITDFAGSKSSKISEYDQWKDSCIGIDREKGKIFHVQKKNGNVQKIEIDLSEVSKCKLTGVNMTGNLISNTHKSIDEIALCFGYREAVKPETSIEFFNLNTDFTIVDQDLKLAEKWLRIVNSELANSMKKN